MNSIFYTGNAYKAYSQKIREADRMRGLVLSCLLSCIIVLVSIPAQAALVGTELSLRTLAQATPTSTPVVTSFETTVVVSASEVEFPDVGSLYNPGSVVPPGFAESIVNVAIDVGNNFIEIDFDNAAPYTRFASAFENTYIFRFDSTAIVDIVGAEIDTSVTTLGLVPSDIRFTGNELFVNVESLTFSPTTFARINLLVEGGPNPVPVPAAIWLFGSGLIGLLGFARHRDRTP